MIAFPAPIARLATHLRTVPAVRWRLLFFAALGVLIVVSSLRYAAKIQKPSELGTQTRSAFLRWRAQIVGDTWPDGRPVPGLKQGADIYRLYNYPNPPVMPLILWPFFELPPTTGALVWFYLKAAMAVALVLWAFRLCEDAVRPLPDGAKAVTLLLGLHPILGDLSHGNVNIFIAFLVMGGLELYRRGRDVLAGVVLGLAIACKVTPALFLPYFVWKRSWKMVAATLAGVALWLIVVPGALLGWERNQTLLTNWFDGMVRPFVIDGKITSEHANQSIPGLVARLLTAEPSEVGYDEDGKPFGASFDNIVDIGPKAAKWLVRGCQAAFVLAVVLLCRAPRGERSGMRFAAELSLIVLGMLLFSERTWKHHAVALVLPYAVLTAMLATPLRGYAIATLVATAVLAFGPSLLGGDAQDTAQVFGSHTAVFLLLTAAMCVVMGNLRCKTSGSFSGPPLPAGERG